MANEQNLNQEKPEEIKEANTNKENISNVAEIPKPTEQEKVLKQSEVDNLVGITRRVARQEGYDRAKADLEKQYAAQIQQASQPNSQSPVSEEEIRRMIETEAQKRADFQEAQRVITSLDKKIAAVKAEGKYPDFDETVLKLGLDEDPYIAMWADTMPNTADVLYEMGKNPSRFASVISLVDRKKYKAAYDEMQKLSNSIIQNSKAKDQKFPSEPLGQIKPTASGADNGSLRVSELRKIRALRT